MVLPLTPWAEFSGEFHHGQDLDAFLMGSLGVNPATREEVTSTTGWLQLALAPREGTRAHLMSRIDDPEDDELVGSPAPSLLRTWNLVWGANVKQIVYERIVLGLEFQRFDTKFLAGPNQQANLIWISGIMNF